MDKVQRDDLAEMMKHTESAALLAAGLKPDVIIQSPALGVLLGGVTDEEVVASIEQATGIPTITITLAIVEALRHLQANNVLFVAPYNEDLARAEAEHLESYGIRVLAQRGLGILHARDLVASEPGTAYRELKRAHGDVPDAKAVVFAGGGYRTFEMIAALEAAITVPVVTSNQAALWRALRLSGVHDSIPSLGALFS